MTRLEMLQPEKDDSEIVGLLYELFYAPGYAMQMETMILLMK